MNTAATDSHLFCSRCNLELHPGEGNFYVVRIEVDTDARDERAYRIVQVAY